MSKKKAAEKAFRLFCTPMRRSVPKQLPANAEAMAFTMPGGVLIKGYRWNHPQPKKALLLHGFESAAHKFEWYAKALVKKGYEVLAFDAPAHGNSGGYMTNALVYSNMIKKIIELYGPIDSYLAHSFGGISLSITMEDIPHTEQNKIVLIAPATETSSAVSGAFKLLGITDKAVRKEMDNIIFNIDGKPTTWYSIRRAVKNINAKILWFHDEEDDVTPYSDALRVKEDNHSHINFVTTKGLGHRKIYHDTDVKKQVLDFL